MLDGGPDVDVAMATVFCGGDAALCQITLTTCSLFLMLPLVGE